MTNNAATGATYDSKMPKSTVLSANQRAEELMLPRKRPCDHHGRMLAMALCSFAVTPGEIGAVPNVATGRSKRASIISFSTYQRSLLAASARAVEKAIE